MKLLQKKATGKPTQSYKAHQSARSNAKSDQQNTTLTLPTEKSNVNMQGFDKEIVMTKKATPINLCKGRPSDA